MIFDKIIIMTFEVNMKKLIILLFILWLSNQSKIIAQIYDGGVIIESSYLWTKLQNNFNIEEKKLFLTWGFYYSGKFNLDSTYQIEIRPGFTGGPTFYSTLQTGLILRRKFGSDFLGTIEIFGVLQTGDNSKYASHTIYAGIGVGKILIDNILLMLSIQKPFDNYLGKYFDKGDIYDSNVFCNLLFRLNLELNL
jgi:hypothetical protein